MKLLLGFGFICIVAGVNSVPAQSKTVTNADLERFRERRLQAEREYRENHVRLGMPSPEELEQRRQADIARAIEIGERLRRERVEREMREAEIAAMANMRTEQGPVQSLILRDGGYSVSYMYGNGYRGRYRRQHWAGDRQPIYWRSAGGMVIWEPGGRPSTVWPSPYRPRLSRLQGPR
ncbi:hypothetical protein [Leptolyngbya sp. 7M]|uniref:hypothetical protein n=1 Tax=Leptolyngbya sp. 7M TaxID=2812896 RepID=UPI001B8CA8FF|nr:hypothetical protein [Leptolyngbya sp. 7M]QYO61947.1 hypothetical protein JVX88_17605 [Leptolyngbya sp. 7M]